MAPALVQTKHSVVENTTSAPATVATQASIAGPGMPSRSPKTAIFLLTKIAIQTLLSDIVGMIRYIDLIVTLHILFMKI
jgi:hypothetical protein